MVPLIDDREYPTRAAVGGLITHKTHAPALGRPHRERATELRAVEAIRPAVSGPVSGRGRSENAAVHSAVLRPPPVGAERWGA